MGFTDAWCNLWCSVWLSSPLRCSSLPFAVHLNYSLFVFTLHYSPLLCHNDDSDRIKYMFSYAIYAASYYYGIDFIFSTQIATRSPYHTRQHETGGRRGWCRWSWSIRDVCLYEKQFLGFVYLYEENTLSVLWHSLRSYRRLIKMRTLCEGIFIQMGNKWFGLSSYIFASLHSTLIDFKLFHSTNICLSIKMLTTCDCLAGCGWPGQHQQASDCLEDDGRPTEEEFYCTRRR